MRKTKTTLGIVATLVAATIGLAAPASANSGTTLKCDWSGMADSTSTFVISQESGSCSVRARIDRYQSGISMVYGKWSINSSSASASYGTNAGNYGQVRNSAGTVSSWFKVYGS